MLPALRRLRGVRRGESVSHWPVSLLSVNLIGFPSLVQRPRLSPAREIYAERRCRSIPDGAEQRRRRSLSLRASTRHEFDAASFFSNPPHPLAQSPPRTVGNSDPKSEVAPSSGRQGGVGRGDPRGAIAITINTGRPRTPTDRPERPRGVPHRCRERARSERQTQVRAQRAHPTANESRPPPSPSTTHPSAGWEYRCGNNAVGSAPPEVVAGDPVAAGFLDHRRRRCALRHGTLVGSGVRGPAGP